MYAGWSWHLSVRIPRLCAGKVSVWGLGGWKVSSPSGPQNSGAEDGGGDSLYYPLSYIVAVNISFLLLFLLFFNLAYGCG